MTSYFGILPSAGLNQDIQLAQASRDSKEPQYPLRDKISLQLTDELLDNMLIKLVQQFPPSDKRDTTEKLAIKIRGIVETLLKQLLGKAPNEQVLESLSFMEKSLFTDNEGQQRIGTVLPDTLVADMKKSFAEVAAGNGKAQRDALTHQPEKLMVYATYTRRGGLDINPCRVSDLSWMPEPIRLARQ